MAQAAEILPGSFLLLLSFTSNHWAGEAISLQNPFLTSSLAGVQFLAAFPKHD